MANVEIQIYLKPRKHRRVKPLFARVRPAAGSAMACIGVPPRINKVLTFIRAKACEGISAADMAAELKGSRRLVEIEFRKTTGRSILDEIMRVRFENVELLLRNRSQILGSIAAQCGWKTENALRTAFLKRYGMSMKVWREQTLSKIRKN